MRFVALSLIMLGLGCSGSDDSGNTPSTLNNTSTNSANNTMDDSGMSDVSDEPIDTRPPVPRVENVAVLEDINDDDAIVEVNLSAGSAQLNVYDDLTLDMYAYNGSSPGPVLEAKVGDRVIVHFTNNLPEPTTIHWHGLRIPAEMDGNPRLQTPVQPGETFTYDFVVPDAGTFWYHPHVRTNEQIEKGLYGALLVHELDNERPRHARERVFLLDDILIDGDKIAAPFSSHMEVMHGRAGNALMTNGTLRQVQGNAVAGERERWRLINTSNARTMEVRIEGAAFKVYGNDGGRVEPYFTPELTMPVGRRFDVEVVYDAPGTVTLQQVIVVQNASGNLVKEAFDVAQVDVGATPEGFEPHVTQWAAPSVWEERTPNREESVVLDAMEGGEHGVMWMINGQAHSNDPLFTFAKGDTVRLKIENKLGPEHPFHLHGQFFKIDGEPGVWDTVLVPGLETRYITAYMDNPGEWMMHCHIAEHAELGMMSSIIVTE